MNSHHRHEPSLERQARELAWLPSAPPLIKTLPELSLDATESADMIADSLFLPRLGHYFENLCARCLEQSGSWNIIARNQPLQGEQRTLGEFDFLLTKAGETRGRGIHLEVAVKFYLGMGDGHNPSHWMGPNQADRLAIKVKHLAEHQLQLANFPEAKSLLKTLNIVSTEPRSLVRGRLFYPLPVFLSNDFIFPDWVASDHDKGWWASLEQWQKSFAGANYQWAILPKAYWLSSNTIGDSDAAVSLSNSRTEKASDLPDGWVVAAETLGPRIAANRFDWPLCLAAFSGAREVMRGFVVPDRWLHDAKQLILE